MDPWVHLRNLFKRSENSYHPSYANHFLLVTKSFYWISSNYLHEPMGQISFQYHQSYANHVLKPSLDFKNSAREDFKIKTRDFQLCLYSPVQSSLNCLCPALPGNDGYDLCKIYAVFPVMEYIMRVCRNSLKIQSLSGICPTKHIDRLLNI